MFYERLNGEIFLFVVLRPPGAPCILETAALPIHETKHSLSRILVLMLRVTLANGAAPA
jgi:hypothetical protein